MENIMKHPVQEGKMKLPLCSKIKCSPSVVMPDPKHFSFPFCKFYNSSGHPLIMKWNF